MVCRYVTVDEEAGRALFYAFVESSGNPKEDPVVLWLNGYLSTCRPQHVSERLYSNAANIYMPTKAVWENESHAVNPLLQKHDE